MEEEDEIEESIQNSIKKVSTGTKSKKSRSFE